MPKQPDSIVDAPAAARQHDSLIDAPAAEQPMADNPDPDRPARFNLPPGNLTTGSRQRDPLVDAPYADA